MAKKRSSRAPVSQREPVRSASQGTEDLANHAAQLAEAQLRVAELTRELTRKANEGVQARKMLEDLPDNPLAPAEPAGGATSVAGAVAGLASHALQLTMLRQLAVEEPGTATTLVDEQTKKAQEVVDFYAMVASGVGLLPGMGISFAGVFATQILMVRDIAAAFGRDWTTNKTATAVTALLGTAFGQGIGGGLQALTWSAFPSGVGSVLGIVASPAASYATAQTIGSVFISQFQAENRNEVAKGVAQQIQQVKGALRQRRTAA